MGKYKAVIFDMDGLMFDTETLGNISWKKAFDSMGIDVTKESLYKIIGLNKMDGKRVLEEEIKEPFDYDKIKKLRDNFFNKYIEKNGTPIKKGLLELIEFLEENNIPKVIASSSNKDVVEFLLKNAGLLNHFPIYVAGNEIKRGKPNPDIFLKASEKLNVKPEKCLVVEDSNAGIKAAKNAEIDVVTIPDILELTEESKKIVIKQCCSLEEVIDILK